MANTNKDYLNYDGLETYDTKIKNYIDQSARYITPTYENNTLSFDYGANTPTYSGDSIVFHT